MPMSPEEVADTLRTLLDRSGKDVITLPWTDAYALTDTRRWAESRTNKIIDAAFENHGVIVTYGESGVFVLKDANFSPA